MTDKPQRPSHITQADWDRMPWYAREKAVRAIVRTSHLTVAAMPRAPKPRRRKIRIYRVESHCWEITDGVNTARTASAEAAWRLLDYLRRTA